LTVELGEEAFPARIRDALRTGSINRVLVVGQGTAAVAGESMAAALDAATGRRLDVEALPATELSGFALDDDMSDVLLVAVSQSGTTTDTNRTVDLVRARGASVIGIVNRRNSDLVEKAHGVLYTSDGRDVEMDGLVFLRVEDGRIAEEWASWDYLGLAEQLGMELEVNPRA